MADQPVDTFQCCFESDCPTQPPCQARETEKVSLHERRHGNPKHLAPGSMYGGELRFDKMLYDVVRVHVVGPLRWLVPEQRIYRGCTRSFCAPCLQYVEWEGISFGKGGETSAPTLSRREREKRFALFAGRALKRGFQCVPRRQKPPSSARMRRPNSSEGGSVPTAVSLPFRRFSNSARE